jgi:hypothetical protein
MITVLYCQNPSIYAQLDCDVWDEKRNALLFFEKIPIISHPPCRLWSRMRGLSNAPGCERLMAISSVIHIRQNGGVLEQPFPSQLWKWLNLPLPGLIDEFGGWSLIVNQSWFGHKAKKPTILYIVGCKPSEIPPYPLSFDLIEYCVSSSARLKSRLKPISALERSATPILFASWLMELVLTIKNKNASL